MSQLVFCLMGPTAIGKTDLACQLTTQLPVEIINVDSSLMYKELNIGAAKPSQDVLQRFPHHLVNCCDLSQTYSVAQFCDDVQALCEQIITRGRYPLLVGGTMMYFKALQQGLAKLPTADESIRQALVKEAEIKGLAYLHAALFEFDPESAQRLHPNDYQRVLRAHEIYRVSGVSWSDWLRNQKTEKTYDWVNLVMLPEPREWLHQRIALRLEQMIQEGFLAEVQAILETPNVNLEHSALRSVGYRQAIAFLQGLDTEQEWPLKALYATRQLAKRQITWLRSFNDAHVFLQPNPEILQEIVALIHKILDNKI
jgi:tRNA dimethylallyltransferase